MAGADPLVGLMFLVIAAVEWLLIPLVGQGASARQLAVKETRT